MNHAEAGLGDRAGGPGCGHRSGGLGLGDPLGTVVQEGRCAEDKAVEFTALPNTAVLSILMHFLLIGRNLFFVCLEGKRHFIVDDFFPVGP